MVQPIHDVLRDGSAQTANWPLAFANLDIDTETGAPIYERICRALRAAIATGELPPGTVIPTSRALAQMLGVARNTVVEAYSRLVAEGYLVSNTRRGTRVAEMGLIEPLSRPSRPDQKVEARASERVEIAYGARRVLETTLAPSDNARAFALYSPDPCLYPAFHIGRFLTHEFRGMLAGDPELAADSRKRQFCSALASYLRRSAGVACRPEQILPITSLRAALDLVCRVLIDPGHNVYVEEPAADFVHDAFRAAGAIPHALPSAAGDIPRVSGPPPRLMYVSPSVTFPLGSQMDETRRLAVLDLARSHRAVVFECDAGRELSYSTARLRSLQGTDNDGLVIYFGSFAEMMGSHLGVAYLVLPLALVDAFRDIAGRYAHTPDAFILGALARFLDDGSFALHLRTIRAAYAKRLKAMIETCRKMFPGATVTEPTGGFHVVLKFADGFDEERASRAAAEEGMAIAPLSRFYRQARPEKGLVLGCASTPERLMETNVGALARIVARSAFASRASRAA